MERTKRQQTDSVDNDNYNKKQKVQNELITTASRFESLANETIYEIFEYLNPYHIYQGFFYLNNRFRNLLINTNFPIQINLSPMSKSNFELYHKNMIKPNKHRINILHLSNPFTVDIIFSPPRIICEFIQLETLILDNIDGRYLHNILKHLTILPKLQSLVLTPTDYVQDPSILFTLIFHLPKLKSCKLTYRIKDDEKLMPIYLTDFKHSPIEYFVLNSRFSMDSLNDIFLSLPKLRYLSIDCLVGDSDPDIEEDSIIPEYLKHVSINLDYIDFNIFEQIIKHFFRHVEVLYISTQYDPEYLDAKLWKNLIVSSMPNLRIFDINHDGGIEDNNQLSYHYLIEQFNSSFWIQRKWFFTHQHDWQQKLDEGIFYSTNPYRRKDYIFYWEFNPKLCLHTKENNLKSVKHVHICSKQATQNCVNYFPNVNELTIEHYFKTFDDSISITLNRILPLKQLNKLVIKSDSFPFEEIVKLLYFTSNLHILKLGMLSCNVKNSKLMQQSDMFRYVSSTNKIQNLEIRESCSLESFQWIINLFPQLEYLKTGMNRKEMNEIIRFLFSKSNNKTRRLFFLCISHTPKVCLRELYLLIKSANLLKDYFIKYIKPDLYLWW